MGKFLLLRVFIILLLGCAGTNHSQTNYEQTNRSFNSVVNFVGYEEERGYFTRCTGFFVQPTILVSASHCFKNGTNPPELNQEAEFFIYPQYLGLQRRFEQTPHKATIKAIDLVHDVVLLKLSQNESRSSYYFLIDDDMSKHNQGEIVFNCGNTGGFSFLLETGIISQIIRNQYNLPEIIVSSANVFYGFSGGPLFTSNGKVIGYTKGIYREQSFMGVYFPIRFAKRLLNTISNN